jgi:glutamate mutase epsilon subunit
LSFRQGQGVHTKVNQLTGGFNRLKVAIVGALSFTAGVAILETMTKLVEKTKARMFEDSGHCLTEPT